MGGIIYVCGFYGAGKTTLIRAALKALPQLNYLTTYVTRPPRPGEQTDKQGEYEFVTTEEYEDLRQASLQWDHTEVGGAFYGADAGAINTRLDQGEVFIVAVTSDLTKLKEMQARYLGQRSVLWIDTNLSLANQRVLKRDGETSAERKLQDPTQTSQTADRMREEADEIFVPTGVLVKDEAAFVEKIERIFARW